MSTTERETILRQIQEAGVVGAGGAGFPTHVKLNAQAQVVIVNGAECEPLLDVDRQLLGLYTSPLADALEAILPVVGATRGVFALKGKYKQLLEELSQALRNREHLEVFPLGDYYPAGDEQVLVYEVTGQVVPEGGLPLHVGAVVVNVETLYNIGRALEGCPVTDTFVTVAGEVNKPGTFRFPLGTPVELALRSAGGVATDNPLVVEGGPAMGKPIGSLAQPLTKTSKGLIVLPAEHPLARRYRVDLALHLRRALSACCQCRMCTDLCPRFLLGHSLSPHKVLSVVNHGLSGDPEAITQAYLCSECGVCELYACPQDLSPRRMYQTIKGELAKAGLKNPHNTAPEAARPEREWRRVPTRRLIRRLGLERWIEQKAPLAGETIAGEEVSIPLKQHIGAPAKAQVKVGDQVERGDLIAAPPPEALGACIHASISGRVESVSSDTITIRRERGDGAG